MSGSGYVNHPMHCQLEDPADIKFESSTSYPNHHQSYQFIHLLSQSPPHNTFLNPASPPDSSPFASN